MAKRMIKRMACNVLAIASVCACVGTFTACETSHPKVEMTIEFNGEEYTLDYKLYRKIAPSTVAQFLWLADNGYYDGLCIHDYDSSGAKLYTGAYKAAGADDDDGLEYVPYYETIKTFKNYADFPVSVWMNEDKATPTYTVYGEFSNNNFTVENGALKQSFGSLTMYYTDKDTEDRVYTTYLGGDRKGETVAREYKYNSATSQFFISLSETTASSAKYCTFATLDEDSEDILEDLEDAIEDYIEAEYGEEATVEDFVTEQSVTVDEDDPFVGKKAKKATYEVPNKPIVIKKITVKKY